MWLINRYGEGEKLKQGINYRITNWDWIVVIKFWRFVFYVRHRTKKHPGIVNHGLKKWICHFSYDSHNEFCGIKLNFEYRCIEVDGVKISIELLENLVNPDPLKMYYFRRVGNELIINEFKGAA